MQSIIRDFVMNYFLTNNLFIDKQHGFIKGGFTVLQLLTTPDDWVKSLDEGGQVDTHLHRLLEGIWQSSPSATY